MRAGEFSPDEMQKQFDALVQTTALSQSIPGGFRLVRHQPRYRRGAGGVQRKKQ